MFKDEDSDDWRPFHTYKRKKVSDTPSTAVNGSTAKKEEDEWEYVEDPDSTEGAVYPLQGTSRKLVGSLGAPGLVTILSLP
jgi:actin-related protein 9